MPLELGHIGNRDLVLGFPKQKECRCPWSVFMSLVFIVWLIGLLETSKPSTRLPQEILALGIRLVLIEQIFCLLVTYFIIKSVHSTTKSFATYPVNCHDFHWSPCWAVQTLSSCCELLLISWSPRTLISARIWHGWEDPQRWASILEEFLKKIVYVCKPFERNRFCSNNGRPYKV